MVNRLLVVILSLSVSLIGSARQDVPFAKDIEAFRQKDKVEMPAAGQILFVGSSSFTRWTDVQEYFPGYAIINRGFGGSSLPDVIRFADDVIFKYDPSQIVMYCGENDFLGKDVTADTVVKRFRTLFGMIREKYPTVPLVYVSIKPSPSRAHLMPEMEKANAAIARFLENKKRTVFVDVYHLMLNEQGKPMPDIFVSDDLHMNAKGYAIWQKALQPHLKK